MRESRALTIAIVVFAAGLAAAVLGVNRYDDAYGWVAHTSAVRLVVGRAVGHASSAPSCEGLDHDVAELESLTVDNRVQQQRIPALRASVERVCASQPAPTLIEQLAEADATERALLAERRARLAVNRPWTIGAFVLSTLGAFAAVLVARLIQRGAVRALTSSEERFRLLAMSSRDLIRIHDAAGRPTYVSPSVERLLGYTPDELLAAVPLSLGHPDDLPRMQASLAAIQTTGAPPTTLVYRLRHKDGAYRWFETHTNPEPR